MKSKLSRIQGYLQQFILMSPEDNFMPGLSVSGGTRYFYPLKMVISTS
jgi:hypothetical protein